MKKVFVGFYLMLLNLFAFGQPSPCNNPTMPNSGSTYGIINVSLGALNNPTSIENGFSIEYDSTGILIPDLVKCQTYQMTVTFAPLSMHNVWIDWNEDGDFSDPWETYSPAVIVGNQVSYNIEVPFNAVLGNKIMRVIGGYRATLDPCDILPFGGDVEDYKINVIENNMSVDSVVVEQVNVCYMPGINCQPILRIAVYTTGTQNPASVTGFSFNTNGSSNSITDITDAKVIYTGDGLPSFSCDSVYGVLGASPSGTFNIVGNQILNSTSCRSVHYFWLAYDIALGATVGNFIDAECLSVSVVEQLVPSVKIPNIIAPSGNGLVSLGVEICNNGLDDDCDGLVDCFDSDCSGLGNCVSETSNFFYGLPMDTCSATPLLPNPNVGLYKEWTFSNIPSVNRFAIIGDLDNDGISEIVLNNANNNLVVLDGKTGAIKRNIAQPNYYYAHGVLADANEDGSSEIYWTTDQDKMICYDYVTSSILWGPVTYPTDLGNLISIADFNGDGIPEIFDDQYIINASNGNLMGTFPAGVAALKRPIAVDVLPDSYCPSCSGLEIVVGTSVLTVDISGGVATVEELHSFETDLVLKNFPAYGTRYSTVADVNDDNLLDIVTISATMIFSWDPRTFEIINSRLLNTLPVISVPLYKTVPVTIDDLDNDGDLDFVFTVSHNVNTFRNLIALDDNFNFLWKKEGMAESQSLESFPLIFDLNGDGKKEIIFRPEATLTLGKPYLYILDALSGKSLDSIYSRNGTFTVDVGTMIADIDMDGEVEIITTGSPSAGSATLELMILGSCQTEWVCGRTMWNQHNYHPVFVNDDLTIPKQQQNHALVKGLNAWSIQASFKDTAGNYACPLPDVTVNIDSFNYTDCDTLRIFFEVCNYGRKSIAEFSCNVTKFVSFYNGDPLVNGVLIKTDTLPASLDTVGACVSVSADIYTGRQAFDLFVVVNDSGTNPLFAPNIKFTECKTGNNFDNVNVSIVTMADLTISDDSICVGDSVLLIGTGEDTFIWSFGSTDSMVYFLSPTDTIINLIVSNTALACKDTLYQMITVSPIDSAGFNYVDTNFCVNNPNPFPTITGLIGGSFIIDNAGVINATSGQIDLGASGIGSYVINYFTNGICPNYDSFSIAINPLPQISLGIDRLICGTSLDLSVTSVDLGLTYLWSTGESTSTITVGTVGSYAITATNTICSATDTINVNSCSIIYIPNAFSPNEDGKNDVFQIRGEGIDKIVIKVFDRWGNKVFETTDINQGWDGRHKGKQVSKGVYVFHITGVFINKDEFEQKGNISLLR